ncbi:helix-turn-helix transcriptional regulator [Streptomyces sp. NBC_01304]|uniref:helix-turn-helix transcriptional regulator n=1 Tax=Streptomyces sp. NBC_01304 TaxID=2903818 RepID=UPI002E14855A|nr:helix-turn-helix transcriptional regulator [Streptomyces sp. NBC_01304]
MGSKEDLGAFLRSRRARIQPEQAGLRQFGGRRRVPGLRREELAQLAGVSVDYYTRFEQGRAERVSDEIVDAVASALRLDKDERAHLRDLVHPASSGPAPAQVVRPGLLRLLDSMGDTPAFVVGRRTDLLAWNPVFAALVTDLGALPVERRNKAWLLFLDDEVGGRFVNRETKQRDLVAYLRMDLGRHPDDPAFAQLIDELTLKSADFRRLWAEQEVRDKGHGGYHLRHPAVGEFTLQYETLRLPDEPDQALITYTAEPGSPSEAALRVIAELAAGKEWVTPVASASR